MNILAIETSCDETAIAIVEATGDFGNSQFTILGNALLSQVEIHKPYGGVFPMLAKREHAKNLVPLLESALEEAELLREDTQAIPTESRDKIAAILSREPGLAEAFLDFVSECEPPAIDVIAVTAGPGLEPALWVGVNFAKALALLWDKPLVAVNHMEGHIFAALAKEPVPTPSSGTRFNLVISKVEMPVLALLISGGHTELVLMRNWLSYELVGQTRDDAVGEAFDKVARVLGLPYPGGPEVSKLAEQRRSDRSRLADQVHAGPEGGEEQSGAAIKLPRPMINSPTCDFSFAGLKTAVRYLIESKAGLTNEEKRHIAHEFENAVCDVLWSKTNRALEDTDAQTLVIGGGVAANTHVRRIFSANMREEFPTRSLRIPAAALTTDNAVMIALAGYAHALRSDFQPLDTLGANGNLALSSRSRESS